MNPLVSAGPSPSVSWRFRDSLAQAKMLHVKNHYRSRVIAGLIPFTLALLLVAATDDAGDWPHWRGPRRDDTVEEPSGWKDGRWVDEKPVWEAEVGEGS